jgi:hypothetical protein
LNYTSIGVSGQPAAHPYAAPCTSALEHMRQGELQVPAH